MWWEKMTKKIVKEEKSQHFIEKSTQKASKF